MRVKLCKHLLAWLPSLFGMLLQATSVKHVHACQIAGVWRCGPLEGSTTDHYAACQRSLPNLCCRCWSTHEFCPWRCLPMLAGPPLLQVLINAGQANAATGDQGYQDCLTSAKAVADALGCQPEQVLLESTGQQCAPGLQANSNFDAAGPAAVCEGTMHDPQTESLMPAAAGRKSWPGLSGACKSQCPSSAGEHVCNTARQWQ